MKKTTILVVDDHQLIRETWASILNSHFNYQVVAECSNAKEAIRLAGSLLPDIVLLDINLHGMNGMDAVSQILEASPTSKILGLSMYNQPAYARRMIKDGAMGYVCKSSPASEMFKALEEISCGRKYLCQEIKEIIARQVMNNEDVKTISALSKRELEIIRYIKQGFSSREIAVEVSLSVKTVEVHRYNVLRKLRLPNTAAMVNFMNVNSVQFLEGSETGYKY